MGKPAGNDFWDRVAERYAARPIKDMDAYETMLADVASRLSLTDHVLEIGCGTGGTAVRLGAGVAMWWATDSSAEMVRIARAKDAPANVRFVQAEADETPQDWLANATPQDRPAGGADALPPFDAICAFNLLHLLPDAPATLAALHRQLRPGGLLISKTWCFADMNPLMRRGVIPLLRARGWFPPATFLSEAQLKAMIAGAGFAIEAQRNFGRQRQSHYLVARKL